MQIAGRLGERSLMRRPWRSMRSKSRRSIRSTSRPSFHHTARAVTSDDDHAFVAFDADSRDSVEVVRDVRGQRFGGVRSVDAAGIEVLLYCAGQLRFRIGEAHVPFAAVRAPPVPADRAMERRVGAAVAPQELVVTSDAAKRRRTEQDFVGRLAVGALDPLHRAAPVGRVGLPALEARPLAPALADRAVLVTHLAHHETPCSPALGAYESTRGTRNALGSLATRARDPNVLAGGCAGARGAGWSRPSRSRRRSVARVAGHSAGVVPGPSVPPTRRSRAASPGPRGRGLRPRRLRARRDAAAGLVRATRALIVSKSAAGSTPRIS